MIARRNVLLPLFLFFCLETHYQVGAQQSYVGNHLGDSQPPTYRTLTYREESQVSEAGPQSKS